MSTSRAFSLLSNCAARRRMRLAFGRSTRSRHGITKISRHIGNRIVGMAPARFRPNGRPGAIFLGEQCRQALCAHNWRMRLPSSVGLKDSTRIQGSASKGFDCYPPNWLVVNGGLCRLLGLRELSLSGRVKSLNDGACTG